MEKIHQSVFSIYIYTLLMKVFAVIIVMSIMTLSLKSNAQFAFELKQGSNVVFDFNTIQEYLSGITYMNAMTLSVNVDRRFDLYVGAVTTNIGFWDEVQTYSNIGDPPTVDMVKLRFRNANSTSQVVGFFDLQDFGNPTDIIGTKGVVDGDINCPLNGTNTAGDYLADPGCYQFRIDLKITPDFTFKSGLYTLKIKYYLVEDL